MEYRFLKENQCCGCGVCSVACPTKAISMEVNEEGFLYPVINKVNCIECGKCIDVCTFSELLLNKGNKPLKAYVGRTKDENMLSRSASGGIFACFAKHYIKDNEYVVGAMFDQNLDVVHFVGRTLKDVQLMQGSKYIQSNIITCFDSIVELLKKDEKVLFSGTPCQVAAINQYVNYKKVDAKNLTTCSIICHGVNSSKIWHDYIAFLSSKIGKVFAVNMRDKKYGSGYNMTIQGTKGEYQKCGTEDPFIKIFTKNLALRKSCFNCPYKNIRQISDITIGDFHYAKKYYPRYCDGKGVSVVLVNSEKGRTLLNATKDEIDYEESSLEKALQPNLVQQIDSEYLKKRNQFFSYVNKNGFSKSLSRYTEIGLKNHFLGSGKRLVKKLIGR